MALKYLAILLLSSILLVTLANAEKPVFRTSKRSGALRTNLRFLERQQAAEAAPAPYPAAGITPETPFELPTETEAAPVNEPDQAYGPPDQTYGPPAEAEQPVEPENIYGAPDQSQPPQASEATGSDIAAQNLIQPRGRGLRLRAVPVPLELAPRAGLVEIIRSEPILVYTLKK